MRNAAIAMAGVLAGLGVTTAASAHDNRYADHRPGYYQRAIYQTQRQCDRALARADSRREYNWISRECREDLDRLHRLQQRDLRRDHWHGRDNDRRWNHRDDDDDDDDD